MHRTLDYHTPAVEDTRPHGPAALALGVAAVICTYAFHAMQGLSPLNPTMLVTFPLVAVIPMLGLTAVIRGVDAFAGRRQRGAGGVGLLLGMGAMVSLAAALMGPH